MKSRKTVVGATLMALGATTLLAVLGGSAVASQEASEIKRGQQIAPVPLNLRGKSRTRVYLGSYIVNAQGGCNDCHTNPSFAEGGDPYQGQPTKINAEHYLAGGVHFGPTIVSRNITPDATGKPAGLTEAEFIRLIRSGKDIHGQRLFVMPWPVYRNMTDVDLKNVYAYLSSIPHAEPGTSGEG